MCATRGRYRQFESRATAGAELECAECGVRGREGFRADYGADDEDVPELELLVLCGACWNREFAE